MKLQFVKKQHEVGEAWSFYFEPLEPVNFVAGQYLNITMPDVPPAVSDRLFTIASAPHQPLLQFTTVVGPSEFKQKMHSLQAGEIVEADQLGGDFTYDSPDVIPPAPSVIPARAAVSRANETLGIHAQKRLFIAGGIGITPYISMIRDRLHKKQPINATLLYAGKDEKRPFMKELHAAAATDPSLDIRIYSDQRLTLEQLLKDIPDVSSRVVYLAGSQKFSELLGEGLIEQGMPRQHIKYDYFDGYIDLEY